MTTVISRVYADEAAADGVITQLKQAGFPSALFDKLPSGSPAGAIEATRVAPETARCYEEMLTDGATLVVVRVLLTPLGAARAAMRILDAAGPLPADVATENLYIREKAGKSLSLSQRILRDGPLLLTDPERVHRGEPGVLAAILWTILPPVRGRTPSQFGKPFLSSRFWPQPLLSTEPREITAIRGGRRLLYNPS